ncbi:helix-turn-helix transcriptional regulator [Spiroplasma endosymbiont of Amphibalanus improvisus]|uniref:helix-turn-helix transcriptional regulator n=1 Tax=Spiroplasma endosymbiont of Amphibalanus improvisus TaxID=3066327 RepID=UPI00313E6D01
MNTKIKEMRQELNISQKQLAKAVNVQQSTISRIENNCSTTSYKLILKILLYLRSKYFEAPDIGFLNFDENIFEFIITLLSDKSVSNLISTNSTQFSNQVITWVREEYI